MVELPKGRFPQPLKTGDEGPGLQCKNCGFGIPIVGNPATLPESFEAKCPTCRETRTYRSDEIQILTAVLKQ
jgi:hypothetical protein